MPLSSAAIMLFTICANSVDVVGPAPFNCSARAALDIGTMCVAAIVGVVAAESANVDLDSVLAEQCRLER